MLKIFLQYSRHIILHLCYPRSNYMLIICQTYDINFNFIYQLYIKNILEIYLDFNIVTICQTCIRDIIRKFNFIYQLYIKNMLEIYLNLI
jgi:hypothetical protein